MEYKDTRSLAKALRDEIDKYISRNISYQQLEKFIQEILMIDLNKKKLFKAKGLSGTVEAVLGKDRLSLFEDILKEFTFEI